MARPHNHPRSLKQKQRYVFQARKQIILLKQYILLSNFIFREASLKISLLQLIS